MMALCSSSLPRGSESHHPKYCIKNLKKNGLPMIEQAKFIEDYRAVVYFLIMFDGMFPPFKSKLVFTG